VFLVDKIQTGKVCVHRIFMNFVEPIRDRKKIAQIKNQLRGRQRYRDLLMVVVGINTALRISDLLDLQVEHFLDEHLQIKQRFWIKEQKRGKRQEVVVNTSIRDALEEYLDAYPEIIGDQNNFIFFNTKNGSFIQPIRRGQAWKIISTICKQVGLHGNFGTHSLRKTWGYHARMSGVDLALIMHKLNHESIAYTKRYLGIADDELQAVSQRLNL
jgi:integrase